MARSSKAPPLVVEHLAPTDTSGVARESDALAGVVVCFVNHGPRGKAALEALVKRLGGQVSGGQGPRCVWCRRWHRCARLVPCPPPAAVCWIRGLSCWCGLLQVTDASSML